MGAGDGPAVMDRHPPYSPSADHTGAFPDPPQPLSGSQRYFDGLEPEPTPIGRTALSARLLPLPGWSWK